MQIQSIGNQNIGFKSKNKMEEASAFVNLDDSELRQLAYASSDDNKENKKQSNSITRTLCAIPIVDTIASGILAQKIVLNANSGEILETCKPALSTKVHAAGNTAIGWAVALGFVGLYNAVKNSVVSKSPSLQRFNNEHPVGAFITDVGLILGGFILGGFGLAKLHNNIKEKHPERIVEGQEHLKQLHEKMDNTKFNKETLPKITAKLAEFEEKMPRLFKAGKFALANSMWILAGVAILQTIKHSGDRQEKIDQNYQTLKMAQLQTAKHLVNTLSVERDVLAQNQVKMAKDLRKALIEEKVVSDNEIAKICKDDDCCEGHKCHKSKQSEEE